MRPDPTLTAQRRTRFLLCYQGLMTYAREGPGPLHLPADASTFEDFLKERRLHSLVSMEIASPMTQPCQLPPADVPAAELTEWLDWQGRCTPRRTLRSLHQRKRAHAMCACTRAQQKQCSWAVR